MIIGAQSTIKVKAGAVWLRGTGVPPVNHAQDARATFASAFTKVPIQVAKFVILWDES